MSILSHVHQNGLVVPAPAVATVSPPTVNDLLDRYLAESVPLKAAGTLAHYAQIYTVLRRAIGPLALSAVTPAHLRALRESLLPRYGPGTTRKYLYALSGAFTAAVKEFDWLEENPFRRIRVPTPPPARVRFLSEAERPRLLQACQASRNRGLYLLVLLALCTGARRNELRLLRWRDVDLVQGTLTFERTKNGETRTVPVVGLAVQVLRQWRVGHRHPEAWLFPREQDDL